MKGAQLTSSCLQELSWRHPSMCVSWISFCFGLDICRVLLAMASDGAAPPTGTAEVTCLVLVFLRFIFANHRSKKCLLSLCWISSFYSLKLRHYAFCMDPLEQVRHLVFTCDATQCMGHCWPMLWCQAPPVGEAAGKPRSINGSTRRKCHISKDNAQAKKGREMWASETGNMIRFAKQKQSASLPLPGSCNCALSCFTALLYLQ